MNLMVYALGLEASTRYFDVLHFLLEHFMSIFTMSDFFSPITINSEEVMHYRVALKRLKHARCWILGSIFVVNDGMN